MCLSQFSLGQTFYAVLVADTRDPELGPSCERDLEEMSATLFNISRKIEYQYQELICHQDQFGKAGIEASISKINCKPDDIIFFYYSGHGSHSGTAQTTFPSLSLNDESLDLETLHALLKAKKPRFCLTLGDCCNNLIARARNVRPVPPVQRGITVTEDTKTLRELFVDASGDLLVSSARQGERATAHPDDGSFYSRTWMQALAHAGSSNARASWDGLLADAENRLQESLKTLPDSQKHHSQWSGSLATGRKRAMGLKIDDARYLRLPRKSSNVVFKGAMPAAFSLRDLLPPIGDQGDEGTCVGWSAAYYMRTAMEAAKQRLGSQPARISSIAFSPGWLYGQIKTGAENGCAEGVFLEDALEVMKNKGTAFLACAPASCDAGTEECDEKAVNFKIGDYATLFNPNDAGFTAAQRINAIKTALIEGKNAILIGMLIPPSFIDEIKPHWRAAPGENMDNTIGAHALAVVGYDDNLNGGSFLLVNSWGKEWGASGYIWANYTDLIQFVKNAYQIYPEPLTKPQPQTVTLKGTVDFFHGTHAMAVQAAGQAGMLTYNLTRPYPSGTRFKMNINNSALSYVYILASDQQNRVSGLFPYQPGNVATSAVVPANSTVLMPSADASFTLDEVKGEDYFVIFISQHELQLQGIADKVRNAPGSITEKAYAALGESFIPVKSISHTPGKISYEVKGDAKGTIVPIVVKINHQ